LCTFKDTQAKGEAFSPQKRTSSTSKHENSLLFIFLWVIFALLDPDPANQINADPQPWMHHALIRTNTPAHLKVLNVMMMWVTWNSASRSSWMEAFSWPLLACHHVIRCSARGASAGSHRWMMFDTLWDSSYNR
jgi:hypothetical protein